MGVDSHLWVSTWANLRLGGVHSDLLASECVHSDLLGSECVHSDLLASECIHSDLLVSGGVDSGCLKRTAFEGASCLSLTSPGFRGWCKGIR